MLKYKNTYKVPEWAICYLANGDKDNLSDEDISIIEKWYDENFPKGCTFDFGDDSNEPYFTNYPAFGHRNEYALTGRGEPPFLACDVLDVKAYVDDGKMPPKRKPDDVRKKAFLSFLNEVEAVDDSSTVKGVVNLKDGSSIIFDEDGLEVMNTDRNTVFSVLMTDIHAVVGFMRGISSGYIADYDYNIGEQ